MLWKILGTLAFCLIIVFVSGCTQQQVNGLDQVSVRLPIPTVHPTQATFYLAQDQGFFEQEGVDVTLNYASSQTNPVKMVATGVDDFGNLGGPDTLLVARSQGLPLVAIAVMHRNSDFPVLMVKKESGIETLQDLEGKKVGFFYGHISTDVVRSMLATADVNVEEVDVGFDIASFVADKVDAQWAWRTYQPVILPEEHNISVKVFKPSDYGMQAHGYTIFTTEEMIENNPDVIRRFLKGLIKGIGYADIQRQEAVQASIDRGYKLEPSIARIEFDQFADEFSNSKEYPIGYMDSEMFEQTYQRLLDLGVIENEFDVSKAYTTQFLDEIYATS